MAILEMSIFLMQHTFNNDQNPDVKFFLLQALKSINSTIRMFNPDIKKFDAA
jgi:hypothetical protein